MKKNIRVHALDLSELLNEDTEFLPLMSDEDEAKISKEEAPDSLPILPLRNTVLFPGVIIPITIGRDKSVQLIKDAESGDKMIGVVAQKDFDIEVPEINDLHEVGTVASILKMLKMPDGNITVVIQGRKRFKIAEMTQDSPYFKAKINADYIVMSDYPNEDPSKTIAAAEELAPKFKEAEFGTFFCPQSKIGDLEGLVSAFAWAANSHHVDYIGFSILNIPNAYGVEKNNKLQRYLSRLKFMQELDKRCILQQIVDNKKKIHFSDN